MNVLTQAGDLSYGKPGLLSLAWLGYLMVLCRSASEDEEVQGPQRGLGQTLTSPLQVRARAALQEELPPSSQPVYESPGREAGTRTYYIQANYEWYFYCTDEESEAWWGVKQLSSRYPTEGHSAMTLELG